MSILLTDPEVARLLADAKAPVGRKPAALRLRSKRGHDEAAVQLRGSGGDEFRLIVRRSQINPFAFSVILALRLPQSGRWFRLRRMNGKNHQHTNRLESVSFHDFHIHTATERYQDAGFREDTYAEPTDRFADVFGAYRCLVQDAQISDVADLSAPQPTLWSR